MIDLLIQSRKCSVANVETFDEILSMQFEEQEYVLKNWVMHKPQGFVTKYIQNQPDNILYIYSDIYIYMFLEAYRIIDVVIFSEHLDLY